MAIKDLAQNVAIAGFTALGVEKLTDKAHELERMATGETDPEEFHKSAQHALLLYQQAQYELLQKIADALAPEAMGDIEESIVIPVYPQSLQLSRFGRPHSMIYVKSSINLFVEAPGIGQFTLTGLAVGWNQLDFADGVRISIPSGGSPTIALYRCSVNGIGATNPAGTTAPASNVTVTNFPSTQPVSGTFWQATQPVERSAVSLYSTAQTTVGTANSGDISVGNYTEISIDLNLTAVAGTNPTIQFVWSRKGADGIYYPIWTSELIQGLPTSPTKISTSIGAGMEYPQSLSQTGQLSWTVGGTSTPTYTFTPNVEGK